MFADSYVVDTAQGVISLIVVTDTDAHLNRRASCERSTNVVFHARGSLLRSWHVRYFGGKNGEGNARRLACLVDAAQFIFTCRQREALGRINLDQLTI